MIRNYFRIALRAFLRNGVYSFINVAGLSVGIACSILILLWVYDEVTFDRFFPKYEQLHRVQSHTVTDQGITTNVETSMPMREHLLAADSRIKRYAITVGQYGLLSVDDKKINKVGYDVSESFLEMFDFQMLSGHPETALDDPRSIVLTKSTATALFGDEDPIGKTVQVKLESKDDLKVTGVIADPPANLSLSFDFLLPFSYFEATSVWVGYARNNWNNTAFQTFVELQPGVSAADVSSTIRDIVKKNNPSSRDVSLFLHPMSCWHLYGHFENGQEAGGMIAYVTLFAGIAIFILIMACINFMNLATARSEHRAREVGIRKSVGSSRKQLIAQFMGESIFMAVIAFALAMVIVQVVLPFYNMLIGKHLAVDFTSPLFWTFSLSLILITGVLAGSYPAFYLSSFRPSSILRGTDGAAGKGATPRRMLVSVQFAFSILLIIGTVAVHQQIHYLQGREPGYDRENLLMITSTSDIEKNYQTLKRELLQTGAAVSVCKSNSPITRIFATSEIENWTGKRPGQHIEATNIATEYDYTRTMGIQILEGRDFSEDFKSDTTAIIINQAAVEALGLRDPVGDKLQMWGQTWNIIGVMDNVLMGSQAHHIGPLVMSFDPSWSSTISVRLPQGDNLPAIVTQVGEVFKKYNPDYPFEYKFADADFATKFQTMNMISDLARAFTLLAIFITGLGLFGMAAFTAERRAKEIGIRKVMGASVASVVLLLTREFSRLVVWAFVLAAPVAWWGVHQFLERYPVRIGMPWWIFPVAGVTALLITVIIVSAQAIRAAIRNPVDTLRRD
ncbi:ABC transporter permease [Parachryseolinea silvisoli]|uniref:ABC transporter permease n=1 Tax=Parachryseolinea silvisoli TaxID=2873601 RepID=UPI002265D59F|nr:ABC transporter permease [Parachryseolinea silvisoli]MCD9017037.1 ABC transporter permease [Parachryseolinea silvisoli]